MDGRRTRVLFQLRFIDNEEGRNNDYTGYSTEWLESYYGDRLNYLLKHGNKKEQQEREEMRRKQKEKEEKERQEEEKRKKIQEQLERERQEEERKKREKERLVLWRSVISLMGYDVIFQNYTRANFNGLWNGMVEEYPEITAFIDQDELRIFFDQLKDVRPDPYAHILSMFAEKGKFDKLVTKNFSPVNKFKILPLNEVYEILLNPTENKQIEESMRRFQEQLDKDYEKLDESMRKVEHLNKKTTVEITDAKDEDECDCVKKHDICFGGCISSPKEGTTFNSIFSTGDICSRCSLSIYPNEEKWEAVKGFWHQDCFRCKQCNVLLDLNTYRVFNGDIWCKNHGRPVYVKISDIDKEEYSRLPQYIKKRIDEGITQQDFEQEMLSHIVQEASQTKGKFVVTQSANPEPVKVKIEKPETENPEPKVKIEKSETPVANDPLNDIFKAFLNNPPVEKRKEERNEGSIFETVTQDDVNQFLNSINTSIEQATPYIQLLNAYLKK